VESGIPVVAKEGIPSPRLAKALIRSMTRGTAIAEGVRYIHVGHAKWLAAQQELLAELADDGHSETKFVRGAYGAGKSHFLSVVQERARNHGWMTAHIECKADGVQIDRFESLYPKITAKLVANDVAPQLGKDADDIGVDPIWHLLKKWGDRMAIKAGVKEHGLNRPFDADNRMYVELQKGLLRSNLPPEFTKALAVFARAYLADDHETLNAVCGWLRGTNEKAVLPSRYLRHPDSWRASVASTTFELRAIGKGTARDVMRGLLWLIRGSKYAGLVLCIDEVEELARLGSRKRQDQALQALREYVDDAGDPGYRHLCIYLAATPEMFEGKDYFPRYDALATRIQPVSGELNWRAPVVDLDRTPLEVSEMHDMAMRIAAVHSIAYGAVAAAAFTPKLADDFVRGVVASRFRIAKPRLLSRLVVDELERARQVGETYAGPADVDMLVGQTATRLSKEAKQ
jgi:hypothetical protein